MRAWFVKKMFQCVILIKIDGFLCIGKCERRCVFVCVCLHARKNWEERVRKFLRNAYLVLIGFLLFSSHRTQAHLGDVVC